MTEYNDSERKWSSFLEKGNIVWNSQGERQARRVHSTDLVWMQLRRIPADGSFDIGQNFVKKGTLYEFLEL